MRKPLNPTVKKSVRRATALSTLAVLALAGCSAQASTGAEAGSDEATPVLDQSVLHEVDVTVEEETLSSDDWTRADVTIDGEEYADAGVRLAGGPGDGRPGDHGRADDRGGPEDHDGDRDSDTDRDSTEAPWLISLDEFVDDQSLDGITELAVVGDDTGDVLGQAVRLDLMAQRGAGDEVPVASSFSVNDSEEELRLLVPLPGEERPDGEDAEELLDKWVDLLGNQAGDLVDPDTLQDDADSLREHLSDGDFGDGLGGPGSETGRGPGGSGDMPSGPHGPGGPGYEHGDGHGDEHGDEFDGDADRDHPGDRHDRQGGADDSGAAASLS
ncbi:CotH family protein [Nocardioides campestrisoli]|uniref:hypothetical protein n=1 Tax=Nocardioides campestrisoli TaxID=2736757 RepID=UPI0015E7D37B|nr:hypothetical protein [Nocardioides campestrisoli]